MFINKQWGTKGEYEAEKDFVFQRFNMDSSAVDPDNVKLTGIGSGHTSGGRVHGVTFRNFHLHCTDAAGCDDFDVYDCKAYGVRGKSVQAFQFDQAVSAGLKGVLDDGQGCANSGLSGKCYAYNYTYLTEGGAATGSMVHFHRNNHKHMYVKGNNRCRNCDHFVQNDDNSIGHEDWEISGNSDVGRGSVLGLSAKAIYMRAAVKGLSIHDNGFYGWNIDIHVTDFSGNYHKDLSIYSNTSDLAVNSHIVADMFYYASIYANKATGTSTSRMVDGFMQVGGFYGDVFNNQTAAAGGDGVKVIKNRNGELAGYLTIKGNKLLNVKNGVSASKNDCKNLTMEGDDIINAREQDYNIDKPIIGMNALAQRPQQYVGAVNVAGFSIPANSYHKLTVQHDYSNSLWYAETADLITATVGGLTTGVYVDGAMCISNNTIEVTLYNRNSTAFNISPTVVRYFGTKTPVTH